VQQDLNNSEPVTSFAKRTRRNGRSRLAWLVLAKRYGRRPSALQEAQLRGQIDATHELIAINANMLKILRDQYAKGYASELDVAAQESQLAQVAATLPPLLRQLAQQRDLLAVLAGGFPNQDLAEKSQFCVE
jgi:hypothetical protein